jgi:hypothetical protein
MGKNLVREFISGCFKTAVQSVLDKALHGEETANFQFPLITKAGARIDVLLNATTRRDEQGNIIGVVGIGQDITGRIAHEREYSKLIDTVNAVCLKSQHENFCHFRHARILVTAGEDSFIIGSLVSNQMFSDPWSHSPFSSTTANLWGGHRRASECLESVR